MAWLFEADCPDCSHHWEGMQTSLHIGPLSLKNCATLFCPRCRHCLYYPKVVERSAWKHWYDEFFRSTAASSGEKNWLLPILARVDASFQSARWYAPNAIDFGELDCPTCGGRMTPLTAEDGKWLICPKCGGDQTFLSSFSAHASLLVDIDGFL
ncbi:MAG: hypothetical protein L0Y72_04265 [Gemmataceae bacterium]|nr:hypothetical protein [Gemmataceae bacterium]MCI0738234.1 hypothetical protein [Gemmataceae bacterium]